ncbi:MAG: Holliday junction resolvase RuvX [Fusobacteriota bacterium]
MKILALDVGDVRIGVAKSDALGIIAAPMEVIKRKEIDPYDRINEIIKKENINKIVIGIPYSLDGTEKRQAEKVREFIDELKQRLGKIEIITVDERYTTVAADNMLKETTNKGAIEKRKVVDKIAASIILQTYLNRN